MSELMSKTAVVWAVLDADANVVLLCSGEDAADVIEDWVERGYRAVCVGADEVRAA